MKTKCAALLLGAMGLASSVAASENAVDAAEKRGVSLIIPVIDIKSLAGTWEGHIGKAAVNVCINGYSTNYYYLKYKQKISLDTSNENKIIELSRGGIDAVAEWKLEEIENLQIKGKWIPKAGGNFRDIYLKKRSVLVKKNSITGDAECNNDFYEPLSQSVAIGKNESNFQDLQISRINIENINGYSLMSKDSTYKYEAFKINKDEDGINKFNENVNQWIKRKVVQFYDCQDFERTGSSSEVVNPIFMKKNILVTKTEFEGYCGGAHGSHGYSFENWDISSGVKINMWDFVKDKIVVSGCIGKENKTGCYRIFRASGDLHKYLNKIQRKDIRNKDCLDTLDEKNMYDIRLSKNGLIFKTVLSDVVQACESEIEIPHKTVIEGVQSFV